jgi:hypothetical protein
VPGKTTTDRTSRLRRQVLDPARQVAAFDLENTLIASNVVESYSWLATRRLDRGERLRYTLRTLKEAPGLLKLDRVDRGDFLRHFYRRYEDAPLAQIETDSQQLLTELILTKGFPPGLRRVREHRALGHRTILITGALDFAVEGLRPLFDEIVAAEMSVRPTARCPARCCRCRRRRDARPDPPRLLRRRGPAHRGGGRLRRLDERPAPVGGRRLPGRGEPRDPAGGDRPQARLVGRALVEGQRRSPSAAAVRPGHGRARAAEVRLMLRHRSVCVHRSVRGRETRPLTLGCPSTLGWERP